MNSTLISILLAMGAVISTTAGLIYFEKKDNNIAKWTTLAGFILFALALGASMMNNALAGGLILVGSILIGACGYYYTSTLCKEDTSETKKRGLIVGTIVGIALLTTGGTLMHTSVNLEYASSKMRF